MGVEKSSLNNEKIKEILKKDYNIEATKIEPINRGTSNIFKIHTNSKKYILKEFTSKRTKETIIKEINIINFLQQRKINVPQYIQTIDGTFCVENKNRIIIIQEFIEGYTFEDNTGNYEKVIECAKIYGKLVKALKDYQELDDENIIEEQFSKQRLQSGIQKMQQLKENIKNDNIYKKEITKDLELKIEMSKQIEEKFDFDILNKLTMLNGHGDYCTQQLIYTQNDEPTVIDFEKAKKLPIVWEVMRSYSYIDKSLKENKINIDNLVDYFKEFMKYVKLNKYDLKYASYIYLIQLVSSIYGYKEYNNDYEQKHLLDFAFYRTKLCKLLYENLEEISNRLEKL